MPTNPEQLMLERPIPMVAFPAIFAAHYRCESMESLGTRVLGATGVAKATKDALLLRSWNLLRGWWTTHNENHWNLFIQFYGALETTCIQPTGAIWQWFNNSLSVSILGTIWLMVHLCPSGGVADGHLRSSFLPGICRKCSTGMQTSCPNKLFIAFMCHQNNPHFVISLTSSNFWVTVSSNHASSHL